VFDGRSSCWSQDDRPSCASITASVCRCQRWRGLSFGVLDVAARKRRRPLAREIRAPRRPRRENSSSVLVLLAYLFAIVAARSTTSRFTATVVGNQPGRPWTCADAGGRRIRAEMRRRGEHPRRIRFLDGLARVRASTPPCESWPSSSSENHHVVPAYLLSTARHPALSVWSGLARRCSPASSNGLRPGAAGDLESISESPGSARSGRRLGEVGCQLAPVAALERRRVREAPQAGRPIPSPRPAPRRVVDAYDRIVAMRYAPARPARPSRAE